jgi:hypothetical protein
VTVTNINASFFRPFDKKTSAASGNVHSADGWEGVLKPVEARYRGNVSLIYFRRRLAIL